VDVEPQSAGSSGRVNAPLPRRGKPVDVGTADGSRYRIAAVNGGIEEGGATPQQSSPPPGTKFAYIEYVLTNPSKERVLLDFPGDVFLERDLVAEQARGRCMWQAGVPEDMCTPPTRSEVVRRLAGGALASGDGGDKYLPPGSSHLVRATVEVPVSERLKRADLRLYIWKQLYMADRLAKQAPFPG
jgi:hypothetical protein